MKQPKSVYSLFYLLLGYGALFIPWKWLSLTCFVYVASLIPYLFWSGILERRDREASSLIANLLATLFFFGVEAFLIWAYLRFGPFAT